MLMNRVLSNGNVQIALERVERNKGSHGIDGMSVEELRPYLRKHWQEIRRALSEGTYQPNPVRRFEIPKPDGGVRLLGIPTVLDRFIQQAIAQVLTRMYDPTFSQSSYGFRPGIQGHSAVRSVYTL